jgi:hypothetical protein
MKLRFLLLALNLLFCSTLFAQSNTYKNVIGFKTDNDGFLGYGSDRYYTAGNFFYFKHALTVADTTSLRNKILNLELGQKIYTPQSANIPGPKFIDRPFAGYLYFSTMLNLLYKNQSSLQLEAQLGVVGPNCFGEQVQDLIHSTFHFYTPGGWQYQILNDYEVNLSARYNHLVGSYDGFDMTLNGFANLGTGLTSAGGGFTARFGKFNPQYNSQITASNISAPKSGLANSNELFAYAKPYIEFIAHDATIQGSIFESEPGMNEIENTLQPVVLNEQLGGCFVGGHWIVDISAIYQTKTTQQLIHKQGHQWGIVSVYYRF